MRKLAIAVTIGAVAWLLFLAVVYGEMRRPPEKFAAFMANLPGPLYLVLPFETLWLEAREGALKPGDPAPDFELQTIDKTGVVRLSSLRGSSPVVLIFGSYT
jgi:hypothetical protein